MLFWNPVLYSYNEHKPVVLTKLENGRVIATPVEHWFWKLYIKNFDYKEWLSWENCFEEIR